MINIIKSISNFGLNKLKGHDLRTVQPPSTPPTIKKILEQSEEKDYVHFVPELLDAPEVFLPDDQFWSWVDLQVDKLNSSLPKRK